MGASRETGREGLSMSGCIRAAEAADPVPWDGITDTCTAGVMAEGGNKNRCWPRCSNERSMGKGVVTIAFIVRLLSSAVW